MHVVCARGVMLSSQKGIPFTLIVVFGCIPKAGWGALSDTLIDYILALATNNRIGRDGNIAAYLLEC